MPITAIGVVSSASIVMLRGALDHAHVVFAFQSEEECSCDIMVSADLYFAHMCMQGGV